MAIDPYKQRTSPTSARLPAAAVAPNISGYGNGLRSLAGGIANAAAAIEKRQAILKQRQDVIDEDNERTSMIADMPDFVNQEQELRDTIAARVGPSGAGYAEAYSEQHEALAKKFNDRATTDVGLRMRRTFTGQAEVRAVEEGYRWERETRQTHTAGLYEEQFRALARTALGNPEAARLQLEVLIRNMDKTGPETLTQVAKARLLTLRGYVAGSAVEGLIDNDPIQARKDLQSLIDGDEIKVNAWAYKFLGADDALKLMAKADQEVEAADREGIELRSLILGRAMADLQPEIAVEQILGLPRDMIGPTMAVYTMFMNARQAAKDDARRTLTEGWTDRIAKFKRGNPNEDAYAAMRTDLTRKVRDPSDYENLLAMLEAPPTVRADPRVRQQLIDLQLTNPIKFRDVNLLQFVTVLSDQDLRTFQNAQADIRRTGTSTAVRTPDVNRKIKAAYKQMYGHEVDSDANSLTAEDRTRQGLYLEAVNSALMLAQSGIYSGKVRAEDVINSVAAEVRYIQPGVVGGVVKTVRGEREGERGYSVGARPSEVSDPTRGFEVPRGALISVLAPGNRRIEIPKDQYDTLRGIIQSMGRKATALNIADMYERNLRDPNAGKPRPPQTPAQAAAAARAAEQTATGIANSKQLYGKPRPTLGEQEAARQEAMRGSAK